MTILSHFSPAKITISYYLNKCSKTSVGIDFKLLCHSAKKAFSILKKLGSIEANKDAI